MNQKFRRWKWMAMATAIVCVPVAMLLPFHSSAFDFPEYTVEQSTYRFGIYFPLTLVSLLMVLLLVKLLRGFCRWFFRWRVLKWWLLAFGIFLALIPFFYAEENWRGHRAWDNYRHELEAQGEKLDFADYIPPRVPDEKNFAFAPVVMTTWNWLLDTNGHKLPKENTNVVKRLDLNLFRTNQLAPPLPQSWQLGKTTDLAAWQNYYRTMFVTNRSMGGMPPPPFFGERFPLVQTNSFNPDDTNEVLLIEALATNEFPVASPPQTPAADVLLALSKFDVVLEELHTAANQRPLSRFPLGYDSAFPAEILLPHLDGLNKSSQVLGLRASAELEANHSVEALADIKLIFNLIEAVHNEPFEITQSSRISWFHLAMQPVWEGVAGKKWGDAQLNELAVAMNQMDFLKDYAEAVRAECAAGIKIIEHCEAHGNKGVFTCLCDRSEFSFDMWLDDMILEAFPRGWYALGKKMLCRSFYYGQLSGLNLEQRCFSPTNDVEAMRHIYSEINQRGPWNLWSRMLFPDGKPSRYVEAQAQLDLARLALALERHRLANGTYPETLDALAPRFLEKIPRDVINGQPLHYRRTDNGKFLLYSVGWNETDDGGVPGVNDYGRYVPSKGDWVWMFPEE